MKERANPWAKKLDYLIGVPLLVVLSLFRRKRKLPEQPKKIAQLKSSAIGDTVLLSAIIKDLEPHAEVTLFTGNSNYRAAQLIVGEKNVRLLPMLSPLQAIRDARAQQYYDVFIDCDSWPRINALITFFARAKATIGFATEGQGRGRAYDLPIQHSKAVHELENYRNLIRPLGIECKSLPKIVLASSTKHPRRIIFHPWPGGSRATEKMWPAKNWIELAQKLQGYEIQVTAGPSDKHKAEKLIAQAPWGLLSPLQTPSLEDLLKALRDCALVVTVDTGIAHLSAALEQRTVVLHGPTDSARWGAKGPHVKYLKDAQNPRIHLGFEEAEGAEVGVSVTEALAGVVSLLQSVDAKAT